MSGQQCPKCRCRVLEGEPHAEDCTIGKMLQKFAKGIPTMPSREECRPMNVLLLKQQFAAANKRIEALENKQQDAAETA